jgi:hypothetical protein
MTFDNGKSIISLRIKLFAVNVVFIAYIILTYFAEIIKYPIIGLSDREWTMILAPIYLLLVFIPVILNYQYIRFSDDGDFIVFRYFTSGIFGGRKNSVEINKATFTGYKVEKGYFGLNQSLVLFQRFKEGVAQYPHIYISILTKKEKAKIFRALDACIPRV